jgi:hypothetical protein
MLNSAIAPMQIIYGGPVKTAGVLIVGDSGDGAGDTDADYKYIDVAHSLTLKTGSTSALAIEGIDDTYGYWFDNNYITAEGVDAGTGDVSGITDEADGSNYNGLVRIVTHLGDQTAVDATLHAGLSYWPTTAIGYGIAHTAVRIHADPNDEAVQAAFPSGLPQSIAAALFGQKVYDPRRDSTAGGTGSHRKDDPSTWQYYDDDDLDIGANPALCLRDFLVRPVLEGGVGCATSVIPDDFLTAAANICDEDITVPNGLGGTTTIKRYRCSVGLNTGDGCPTNIQKLIDAMAGWIVESAGEVRIYAGAYVAPTTTIDEDWLAGPPVLQDTAELDARWNTVDLTFTDPTSGFTEVQTPAYAVSGAITDDGGIPLTKHLSAPACNNQYRGQLLTHISAQQSRNLRSLTLPCNLKGSDTDASEVVYADIGELNLSSDTFMILKRQRKNDSSVVLTLISQDPDTFDEAAFTEVAPQGVAFTDNYPPTATNLVATADDNGIHLNWDDVPSYVSVGYDVFRSSTSGGTYTLVKKTKASHWRDDVTDGSTWFYKVKARNYRGRLSKSYSNIVSAKAKVVADGADVTLAQLDGDGRDILPAKWALFPKNIPTSGQLHNIAQSKTTSAGSIAESPVSMRLKVTGTSGAIDIDMNGQVNKTNLPIDVNSKWKYTAKVKASAAGRTFIASLVDASGTVLGSSPAMSAPTTIGKVRGVIDLTASATTAAFLRLTFTGGGWATNDTLDINWQLVEKKIGTATLDSSRSQPGMASADYLPEGDSYRVRHATQATLTVLQNAAAAFYSVATIPGSGTFARGVYRVRIGATAPGGGTGTALMGVDAVVHVETGGNCGATGHCGRISPLVANLRIRQATSDGSANLELQITGSTAADTLYTLEVEPIEGTYDPLYVPAAVQDGGLTTGTNLMNSKALAAQKHFVFDSMGANNGQNSDGSTIVAGQSFTDTNGQVTSQLRLMALNGPGYANAYWTGMAITPHPTSLNAASGTLHMGPDTASYGASSKTGLANSTLYYGYFIDATLAGGTLTLNTTTNKQTLCSTNDKAYIADMTTTSSGGAGGGGSIGGCVGTHMYLAKRLKARLAHVGDWLDCADDFKLIGYRKIGAIRTGCWPCVRIETADGCALVCSNDTPFTLPGGATVMAEEMLDKPVLTDLGQSTVTKLEHLNARHVMHISAGGVSFAAGEQPERRIYSHNVYKP